MDQVKTTEPTSGAIQARTLTEQQKMRLQRAVRDFEAIVVGYMLKSARESSPESAMLGEGFGGEMLGGMLDAEFSRTMSASGQLGIAEMLYRQVTGERLMRPAPSQGRTAGAMALPPAAEMGGPLRKSREPARDRVLPTPVAGPGGASPAPAESSKAEKQQRSQVGGTAERKETAAPIQIRLRQTVAERVMTYAPYIREAAEQTGVDDSLLKAVMASESGGNPRARSVKQAKGLMQLMDSTAREVGVGNSWNPRENILGGARYLAKMLDKFDGDLTRAVASYNAGPGAVAKHKGIPPIAETRNYVKKVLGYLEFFRTNNGESND